jgi:hypothetical protein
VAIFKGVMEDANQVQSFEVFNLRHKVVQYFAQHATGNWILKMLEDCEVVAELSGVRVLDYLQDSLLVFD